MSQIIYLDTGPLGMVTNPHGSSENDACNQWLQALLGQRIQVVIPEIADYEVRRELLRANKTMGIAQLDALKRVIRYMPITTQAMLKAAEFWADVRKRGTPTADAKALDGDVILAAQAVIATSSADEAIIATTNVKHLSLLVNARLWRDIP
jgi:predicted nucleic acid-binding protein